MSFSARFILLLVVSFSVVPRAWPASGAETQAFTAAEKIYLDADYKGAEAYFGDFLQKYPASAHFPEAVLYQAQARIKLGDYDGALSLLSAHQAQAAALADWYLLVRGEAFLSKGDFAQAEANFSKLILEFPSSSHRLTAVVNAALAHTRLSQWPQAVQLLSQSNGLFQLVASTNHASTEVIKGYLLLSEAQLAQHDTQAAELSLQYLAGSPLDATNNWQRQYLLCQVLLTDGRLESALQNTTNLMVLADATGLRSVQAKTTAFYAHLLERLARPDDAVVVYQKNLGAGVPAEQQRQALLKIVELSVALGKIGTAAQVLQTFLGQFPTNDCSDLALLTLGELRLRQYNPAAMTNQIAGVLTNTAGPTSFLEQAVLAFESFRTRFPRSDLVGKAQLDLGWCYWLGGNISQSETAFQSAVALLPASVDQAKARFKLADAQFQLTNYLAAYSNYTALVDRFADLPEVSTNLSEPALYQAVRAALAADDLARSTNALAKMLVQFPDGSHTDRAILLIGQQMGRSYPEMARNLYSDFVRTATNSSLLPELKLAIARTYEVESRWDEAIQQYETWLATFTNDQARGQAQYLLARANAEGDHETNALLQFTNFIARFPESDYVPLARWWVGDYFFRAGNYLEAEGNYQFIFDSTNWALLPIAYEARMMAGRAAVERQGWESAKTYFRGIANDRNCTADLRAQGLFALGDTLLIQASTNKLDDYQDAFNAYDLICKTYPTNAMAPLAWGQKAICLLQSARSAQDYATATNAFQKVIESFQNVIESPLADATARSIAEVGLGFALEKFAESKNGPEKAALLNAALRHYQRVFYDNGLLRDAEKPDPFWTRKAGMEAGRLAVTLQMREHAIQLYRRLQEMFPPLHLEDKIKALQAQG